MELSTSGINSLTLTDKLFKTFWHYFRNISVKLAETISSRTMELVLSDKEMDIFNCSFTQKENVLILNVTEYALQCSKQNLIVSPFLVVFFSINSWPSKIPNGLLKMMRGSMMALRNSDLGTTLQKKKKRFAYLPYLTFVSCYPNHTMFFWPKTKLIALRMSYSTPFKRHHYPPEDKN